MNTKPRCSLEIPSQTCAVYGTAALVTTPLRRVVTTAPSVQTSHGAAAAGRGPPWVRENAHPSADTVSSARSTSLVVCTLPSHIPICASPVAVLVRISLIYRHSMHLLAMFSQTTKRM
jgi:hypothetical protein